MALEKTRADLVPVETEVSFHITTEKANEFLQDKVDKLVNIIHQKEQPLKYHISTERKPEVGHTANFHGRQSL